jgi:Uma2 family endonuclease
LNDVPSASGVYCCGFSCLDIHVSIEDYLTGEQAGEIRHEYITGQLFAMVGAGRAHNTIALNIASFFHIHLRGGPCQAFMADMKVREGRCFLLSGRCRHLRATG